MKALTDAEINAALDRAYDRTHQARYAPGFTVGQRVTYRVRDYGEGDRRTGTVVRMGHDPRFIKVRCDDSTYVQTVKIADVIR